MTLGTVDRWTTLRARANSFATTRLGPVARAATRVHSRHPDSPAAVLITRFWLSAPVLRLTVRGRTSGEPRTVSLMAVFRGPDVVVIGGNAGAPRTPNWFRNLRAAGEATVEVDGRSWPVLFREVRDPAEVEDCRRRFAEVYPGMLVYAAHSPRVFPVGVLSPA
ncbi:nitroreductase family deazaflavin-dependent oxidoreductase [Tsukamurella sp. 1534]|uniref:nitroreductase family deazaflavin-dependent oxidoreductase n=1 Tax=Tsukamurella sp. 1534 TaxID=1151061 RepID=UPI0002E39576|nr:nitroreductase family deazaflavin-dependent oxidoreductase [Tsukamurella sp. 1534]